MTTLRITNPRRPLAGTASLASLIVMVSFAAWPAAADDFQFELRYVTTIAISGQSPALERRIRKERWPAKETAVIVCDVWDYHHCLNAVRRLEEFAPRLDAVLKQARERGATIIHAPSDCMDAYVDHPARTRVRSLPLATNLPKDIRHWCSQIAAEKQGTYPLDQSDGGEDDDPPEHAEWAAKLKALGRNPNMPWKSQSPLITIDPEADYISDRGDEVWSILESRGIKRVILAGVHTNMCVLGRPFGLRQMVRNGKQVLLLRDMTDCMYNPARWPYVDHFTGNDLLVTHVERFVCPTITSDQLLGGEPFRFRADTRPNRDVMQLPSNSAAKLATDKQWSLVTIPLADNALSASAADSVSACLRCAIRLPKSWLSTTGVSLQLGKQASSTSAWLNGQSGKVVESADGPAMRFPAEAVIPDDVNLLVLRLEPAKQGLAEPPRIISGSQQLSLRGKWQVRLGDDPSWSNMPLPAKFGAPPDIYFEPTDE